MSVTPNVREISYEGIGKFLFPNAEENRETMQRIARAVHFPVDQGSEKALYDAVGYAVMKVAPFSPINLKSRENVREGLVVLNSLVWVGAIVAVFLLCKMSGLDPSMLVTLGIFILGVPTTSSLVSGIKAGRWNQEEKVFHLLPNNLKCRREILKAMEPKVS